METITLHIGLSISKRK